MGGNNCSGEGKKEVARVWATHREAIKTVILESGGIKSKNVVYHAILELEWRFVFERKKEELSSQQGSVGPVARAWTVEVFLRVGQSLLPLSKFYGSMQEEEQKRCK